MDNLEQLWCQSVQIHEEEYGKCISCSCNQEFVCVITEKSFVCVYDYARPERPTAKKIEGKELTGIHYLTEHDLIFLSTDFEFILCDRNTLAYDVCFASDKKIIALAWNHAETIMAIVDETEKVFLYNFFTLNFELQYDSDLNVEVPSSVYVGWGSENTQFQGPKAREEKELEPVSVPVIELEYKPPKISWRGNGQMLAINYYKDKKRFIKVFDNQLQPLSVSSEYPNLTDPVAFQVAGQHIAASSAGDINTIVIFEKNCQVKSTFQVPENKGTIMKIQYHAQMNMLAVYSVNDQKFSYINVYLHLNNVWLLKQQLYFPPSRAVRDFEWANMLEPMYTTCRLFICTIKSVEYYTFRFIINRSPRSSIVAVVDGRHIMWYNFLEKIVPPPMVNYIFTHSRPINKILFHPTRVVCVALDCMQQVLIIGLENYTMLLSSEYLDLNNVPQYDVTWKDNKVQVSFADCSSEISRIQEKSNFILEIKTVKRAIHESRLPYNDTVSLISHRILEDASSALIYLTKKLLLMESCTIELDFALSSNRQLYLNNRVICSGVTSFFIFQDYLLVTTAACKMYCIRLMQEYEALLHCTFKWEKTYAREIEQGARIVTVVNKYPPLIILVLPRGNLETISCRLLTIDMIEALLSENDWKTVVDITKNERMNWNLLIDLNPERFSEHIKDFVEAAGSASNLSMIVNEFTNLNTYYGNCLERLSNVKCDRSEFVRQVVHYLETTDMVNNLPSIVSIQEKHVSLKSALSYIKTVFELDPRSNVSVCKQALEILRSKGYFNEVIETTYSLFNLDFLTFVYDNSTEDPGVYEPEIASFRNLNPIQLRFKMSLKANNIPEAIKYLVRGDEYDGGFVENFILKNKLEEVAYKNTPPVYKHFETVSFLYAKHLSLKHEHSEAALVLKQANMPARALEEYKKALDWKEVMGIMVALEYDEEKQKEVLYDLAIMLADAGKMDEAAMLLDKYNNDYKKAVEVLVEYKAFTKAISLAKEHSSTEMIDELVVPALKSYMSDLKIKIDEFEATFKKYFTRLQLVREEKKIKLDNSSQDLGEGGEDDLYSETGSTSSSCSSSRGSSRSRSSQLSSKNRRKEARKKIDLREGGYYEDIALIRALHILYSNVFGLGKDVKEVCIVSEYGDVKLAKALQESLACVQDMMKKHISLIWPDVFINVPQVLDNAVLAVVQNKADLDPPYCVPPSEEILSEEWQVEFLS